MIGWKSSFPLMFLATLIDKNGRIFAGIYTLYLSEKRILDQTWQILNTKLTPQWKDWESSYHKRQFWHFFAN